MVDKEKEVGTSLSLVTNTSIPNFLCYSAMLVNDGHHIDLGCLLVIRKEACCCFCFGLLACYAWSIFYLCALVFVCLLSMALFNLLMYVVLHVAWHTRPQQQCCSQMLKIIVSMQAFGLLLVLGVVWCELFILLVIFTSSK